LWSLRLQLDVCGLTAPGQLRRNEAIIDESGLPSIAGELPRRSDWPLATLSYGGNAAVHQLGSNWRNTGLVTDIVIPSKVTQSGQM
jgi:hypothetical protein